MSSTAVDPAYVTAKPVNPAGLPTSYEHGGRLTAAGTSVDPILVEIVQGTLASVEMEVETAIGRTSRSPMIRDAHDFRAGIHDRQLRKLTGRSYSALVHPIVRDYPIAEMVEGDVFFPELPQRPDGEWRLVEQSEPHEENGHRFTFRVYEL